MKLRTLVTTLLLFATPAQALDVRGDNQGSVYPAECRRDLAADPELMAKVNIQMTPTWDTLPRWRRGFTHPRVTLGKVLVVINSYYADRPAEIADIRQHELCHALGVLGVAPMQWPKHQ